MRRILVPTDFSEPSMEAFKMALSIAAINNSEVIVFHAIYIPGGAHLSYDPLLLAEFEKDTEKEFEKMKKLSENYKKLHFEMVYDDVLSAVTHMTKKKKIDLVVMGTTGISRVQEMIIGSNTEKIVRNSNVPVMAIHEAIEADTIKNILLPTNLSLKLTKFIHKVKEVQEFFDATLNILLVNTPSLFNSDAEASSALEEFVKHYKINNYALHFRNYRSEEKGIIDFANNEPMDMVVIGTHARSGLAHLFHKSITEGVIDQIKCPVWTYAAL
ncbi:universal stress protein [Fulvivirga sp. 29W222]|uniref:Universal stress protein n=1 Tax=Fulvivirga marina TaxID=2494733 RepID=A0A937KDM1_9BACT|nr:universal stress protein [Fulvivirga marina]MBL6448772.1 universal stress protein [Fulvivirga marina]